jgi:hypothetical protein
MLCCCLLLVGDYLCDSTLRFSEVGEKRKRKNDEGGFDRAPARTGEAGRHPRMRVPNKVARRDMFGTLHRTFVDSSSEKPCDGALTEHVMEQKTY